ncbi:MAG: hypothetical protein ACM3VS_10660 [Candidatus Dadabacteria bacterium]
MEKSTGADAPAQRKSRTVWKVLRAIIIVFVLLMAGIIYWKYYFTYSSGNRFGLLQKFSHKGNLFKTYEGEMILSSVEGNQNVPIASEKFYFSVTSKRIANQLMDLQGKHVTVHYLQKNGTLSWRGESEYIVDSVVNAQ